MKKYLIIQALFTVFLITVYSSSSNAQTINIDMRSYITADKKVYQQGEKIRINFSGFPGFKKDWIGIYNQAELTSNYINWKYTGGNKQGVIEFEVPKEPGRYELRGFADNGYDRFVTSRVITVRSADITAYNTDWSGTWRTNYNDLILNTSGNTVWGTYDNNKSKVEGIVNGNIITGWWYSNNGTKGRVEFRMSADGNSYTGKWGINEELPDRAWNGTKIITNRRTNFNSTNNSAQPESDNIPVTTVPVSNNGITANDLTGIWDATGYTCDNSTAVEKIKITIEGNELIAVKITGDNCVPAGEVTWEGKLYGNIILGRGRVSSGPRTAINWYDGITIKVIDRNTMEGFLNITYRRSPAETKSNDVPGNNNSAAVTSGMTLNGHAKLLNSKNSNLILLTNDYWQSSSAFMTKPVRFNNNNSFSGSFTFEIDNPRGLGNGADGICFVMQAESINAGGVGGGIGYAGLKQSIAVEFDTYDNGEINDNHIGIDFNGDINSAAVIAAPDKLDDNKPWYAWVDYNAVTKIIEVRVSRNSIRPATAILHYKKNIAELFNNKPVYIGFTSGTGAGAGDHKILAWKFNIR